MCNEFHFFFCRIYEESKSADTPPNMNFDGGLTIPGSIWHRLYRYFVVLNTVDSWNWIEIHDFWFQIPANGGEVVVGTALSASWGDCGRRDGIGEDHPGHCFSGRSQNQ